MSLDFDVTSTVYSVSFAAQSDAVFVYQEGDFMKPVVDVGL